MPALLNSRHETFAQLVFMGESALQAYIKAGFSNKPRNAKSNAYRLMDSDGIRSRLTELIAQRDSKKLVTAAKLHERWSEMFEADISDIMDEAGKLKPVKQWPKIWRQMLSGCDVKELYERSQDGGKRAWDAIGEIVKLKFVGVKDLGELLGKHKAVDAFVAQGAASLAQANVTLVVKWQSADDSPVIDISSHDRTSTHADIPQSDRGALPPPDDSHD